MNDTIPKINCNLPNENALYMAYMPFLQGGGLFVHTSLALPLGTKVILTVSFLTEIDPYILDATVVWITPRGAQSNKPAGLGLQFLNKNSFLNKIETSLAGMLKSVQVNDTM